MWKETEKDGYVLIENEGGKTLGLAKGSRVKRIVQDGYVFKDFLGTGELVPYEDWRLPVKVRAQDLASRLSVEEIAGLMLYSGHQSLPAGSGQGTYGGKAYGESGAKPWELTDQQKEFVVKDGVRHILLTGLESVETAVRWNNKVQALAEGTGFGIPANNSSDPRHSVDSGVEWKAWSGEGVSDWANGLAFTACFDPQTVKEFGKAASLEYRALGITTALSPQIDLGTEPRWLRFGDTFGEHSGLVTEMARAYCDGFQTTEGSQDGWGKDSVNTMVKHFPGGGPCEGGRDAHYAYGKYAVYPGENFKEHLKPFYEGAFRLEDGTGCASAVMPYYTVSVGQDKKYGENVGNSFSRYIITDLLREEAGFDGVVCTDWAITHSEGIMRESKGKCWGMEEAGEAERHWKALEAGVDQFGGNNNAAPLLEAWEIGCRAYGEEAMRKRFEDSAVRLLLNIFRTGLFENPYLDLDESQAVVGNGEFRRQGYLSQLRSVVLLKNKGHVLPLAGKKESQEVRKVYVPGRHIRETRGYDGSIVPERYVTPAGKEEAAKHFQLTETPEEADAAICFVESPICCPYSEEERKAGGNGYLPVTLQYRPYIAEHARKESLAGGDPQEDFRNRSYYGKMNTAANEEDLDLVINTKKRMKDKPVIVVLEMKNPVVMGEMEPYADVVVAEFGIAKKAVLEIICGSYEPTGLLPLQMPKDMETVELQREDVPFDMQCYVDSEGHAWDFGFGMNYSGVISDERTEKYGHGKMQAGEKEKKENRKASQREGKGTEKQ